MKNVEKKPSKLKQFVKKHEVAFTIAGAVVVFAAGVGLIYLRCRNSAVDTDRIARDIRELAAKDENVAAVVKLCDLADKATAGTSIQTFTEPMTIAKFFGEDAHYFLEGSLYQPDDIIDNIIYNIAKKPET